MKSEIQTTVTHKGHTLYSVVAEDDFIYYEGLNLKKAKKTQADLANNLELEEVGVSL